MQEKSVFFINKDGLKGIKKDIKPKVIRESLLVKNSCKYFVLKSEENSYFKTKYVKGLESKSKKIDKDSYKKGIKKAITTEIKERIYELNSNSYIVNFSNFIIFVSDDSKDIKRYKKFKKDEMFNIDRYDKKHLLIYAQKRKSDINIFDIFKKIDKNLVDIDSFLDKNMKIDIFIKIKLYKLYKDIITLVDGIEKSSTTIKYLNNFRDMIFEALALIDGFEKYINSELSTTVSNNLKNIYLNLNYIDELNILQKNIKKYKNCLDSDSYSSFITKKDEDITIKVNDSLHFFETKEFAIIMDQFESMIKDSMLDIELQISQPFYKKGVKKALKKAFKTLFNSYKEYFDCKDMQSYQKIVKDLRRVLILNELTKSFVKSKKFYQKKHLIKAMEIELENYIDNEMLKFININNFEDKKIVKCLNKKDGKKIKNILESIKSSKKSLKNNIF